MTASPVAPSQPVLWTALGYPFEAASMLAALAACVVVRVWIYLKARPGPVPAKALDVAVTLIALLFSAAWVALQRPAPFFALLSGCGFGALGSGVIALSLNWLQRVVPAAGGDERLRRAGAATPFDRSKARRRRARRTHLIHRGRKN